MRNPTIRDMALRDPALAAMLGALPGADFGVEFGGYGRPQFGADEAQEAAAWAAHNKNTASRERILEPNKGSSAKIQRYTFSLNATITALGTAQSGLEATNAPDTNFRPQRVTVNTPAVGFLYLSQLRVANVQVIVGGSSDAHQFNPNAVDSSLDLPTLSPANRATFSGSYTGTVPAPLTGTGAYTLAVSFSGPASIVA